MAAKLARFSWLPGGLGAALIILVGRLLAPEPTDALEASLYDRVVRARATAAASEIAIIAIDNESIERLGPWPWSERVHADLVERLTRAGARVVGFVEPIETPHGHVEIERIRAALALLESSDLRDSPQAAQLRSLLGASGGPSTTSRLRQAIQAHGNVVLPVALQPSTAATDSPAELLEVGAGPTVPPWQRHTTSYRIMQQPSPELLHAARAVGHTFVQADQDGTARTDQAFARVGSLALPSLAMAVAARAAGLDAATLLLDDERLVVLGRHEIKLDAELRAHPEYHHTSGPRSFPQYSYWRALAGEIGATELEGRIVLIGVTDADVLPIQAVATPAGAEAAPVNLVASATSSYLQGRLYSIGGVAAAVEWLGTAAAILFAAFLLPVSGVTLGLLATMLIVTVLIVTEVGLLSSMQAWARLMLPTLAAVGGFGFYVVSELVRRANAKGDPAESSAASLRSLGQTFQSQGQLDLAFETYRRCPLDAATMELLYYLGLDFERRHQAQKAAAVYAYIATRDPNYRDLRARRARLNTELAQRSAPITRAPATRAPATRPPLRAAVEDHEPTFSAVSLPPGAPRRLGRYEIERELGKGAMGVVYLGRDPKINRVVAIKAIPLADEFEDEDLEEARARFFREAEMAGRLNHPAIVTIYDAGEDQGLAYIAMEYLRGQHLSHFADPARLLPPITVMLLVARVADALHYAHRQNVVHRDIKPANIMFNPDTDELKITDFGIARLTDVSRTKTGIVLGTPSFMSPEQLEGRPIDGRSDQFALGVSLYQLLCGQLPFRAESMPRLMQKIATEPHAPIRLIRPELPACIDVILNRALAKNADDRYATCGELGLALRECAGSYETQRATESHHEWLLP
ncbi:MAG: serine/threonine-protein kinase [Gammaproteobacteria bacterium]|nr:serine/threonine protein kinase [Gammaproteobacteria bacterium]